MGVKRASPPARPRRKPVPEGLSRGARKEETRRALVDAALEEFSARGLDLPSLDDICARAGYTRGAFYVHFRDRDELLAAAMERLLGGFLDAIVATSDAARDLDRSIERFIGMAALAARLPSAPSRGTRAGRGRTVGILPFHHLLDACARSATVRERFVTLLGHALERLGAAATAGQAAGTVRADLGPHELASLLVVLALGLLAAVESHAPVEPEALRRSLLALLHRS